MVWHFFSNCNKTVAYRLKKLYSGSGSLFPYDFEFIWFILFLVLSCNILKTWIFSPIFPFLKYSRFIVLDLFSMNKYINNLDFSFSFPVSAPVVVGAICW